MRQEQKFDKDTLSSFTANCSLLIILLFIVNCSLLIGLDFNFRPKGFLSIPMGSGNTAAVGKERYNLGGGGDLGFEVDLSTVWPNPLGLGYTAGLEGGLLINPSLGDNGGNVSFYSIGGVIGLYYFPLSRLFTRVDGTAGVQQSARTVSGSIEKSDPGLFWRAGGEVGFRFTPGFTLAANAGWRQYTTGGSVLNSGLYAGLTAQLTFQTGQSSNREGINASLDQGDAVYPALMQLYQTIPIGTVAIQNNENAEIRDVHVFFRASGYTASEFPCGTVSLLPRGRSAELPLLADFSPGILGFTDSGRILGELVIRYNFLGQARETVRAVTVATHDRNAVAGDAPAPAAFISPTSPETLDFARFIAGLARANPRTGHNQNMQYAIWLLEGLRASGIRQGETYTDESEAQFPAETLSYRTGSARDLALLFAAALEGVGIPSAFVNTGDNFLVAVDLGINQSAAETLFNGTGKILVINGDVWLPLSLGALNNGFMACWAQAADTLNKTFNEGKQADFVNVAEAWAHYPPAPLPALGGSAIRTDTNAAVQQANSATQQYIDQELAPILRQIQTQISGNPTAALYNRLGILQARSGHTADAKTAYERAASMGSVPAMTNRGNLALIERDYTTAEKWFKQALAIDSQNNAALQGMEKVKENK